jgi:hypothetical protein
MPLSVVESLSEDAAGALTERRIDFRNHREMLEANLARQTEAIRAADIKIALLVPTTTAMLGVLAALMRDARPGAEALVWVGLTVAPLFLAFAMMAAGVIPRLRGSPSRSLLYFGDLAALGAGAAQTELLSVSSQAYLADLATQCHTTARIAQAKHRAVRRAYLAFLLALPFWLATIWVLS